jgi:cysteine desulfurase
MGLGFERALGAVRLSLGRWSTLDEIESAAAALIRAYGKLADLRTSAV